MRFVVITGQKPCEDFSAIVFVVGHDYRNEALSRTTRERKVADDVRSSSSEQPLPITASCFTGRNESHGVRSTLLSFLERISTESADCNSDEPVPFRTPSSFWLDSSGGFHGSCQRRESLGAISAAQAGNEMQIRAQEHQSKGCVVVQAIRLRLRWLYPGFLGDPASCSKPLTMGGWPPESKRFN